MSATWDAQELLEATREAARSRFQGEYAYGRLPPHAYGVKTVGVFHPNPMTKRFGGAIFQGEPSDVHVRFSVMGGGNAGLDHGPNNLGLAVRFPGDRDLLAVNTALFPVKNPAQFPDFLEQVLGDPQTTWGPVEQFLKENSESIMATIAFGRSRRRGRPASFAEATYHGAHAFWLALAEESGSELLARYRWQPAAGDRAGHSWADAQRVLREELVERLDTAGEVRFTLVLEVAGAAQHADDPREFWPETLERLIAGELVVKEVDPSGEDLAFRADQPPTGWRPDPCDKVMEARAEVYALATSDAPRGPDGGGGRSAGVARRAMRPTPWAWREDTAPFSTLDRPDWPAAFVVEQVTDKDFTIPSEAGFQYNSPTGRTISVTGATLPNTDFTSIPRYISWLVSRHGRHTPAALVHDQLVVRDMSFAKRQDADRCFVEMMDALQVAPVLSRVMWAAACLATRWSGPLRAKLGVVAWGLTAAAGIATLVVGIVTATVWIVVVALLLPLVGALFWGRQFTAGVVGGYALPVIAIPTLAAVVGYSAYWLVETAVRLVRRLRHPKADVELAAPIGFQGR